MNKESECKLGIITFFAIAMGFLEAVVVVYLRRIYYSFGFDFPLKGFIEPEILNIEWIREFATVIMLLSVAILAGKKFYEKFAYFLYAFAIWDIFYYISLKLTLNWPESIFTWDLLFLIPWPWIGPVLSPILWSVLFVIFTLLVISFRDKKIKVKFSALEITLFVLGVFITLYTWLYDYGKLIIGGGYTKDFFTLTENSQFMQAITTYVPTNYNWPAFILGLALALTSLFLFYIRTKNQKR
ncbi:MAG TPA: hypothetical protein PLK34_00750 [Candidatus Pacearchaeota archaeon]|nr:hypothetical protein [Candidatus Pacearchaeota archaeon]